MQSDLPKVFHPLLGRPMLDYVLETLKKLKIPNVYVVVGHQRELIENHFKKYGIIFVHQKEQLGTGHAVLQAEKVFLKKKTKSILVLAGDVPLLKPSTLKSIIKFHLSHRSAATDLTAIVPEAGNYGRIVRDKKGHIVKIIEKKDAVREELKINEINTGTFIFESDHLFSALKEVKAENAQREYYLTDTIEILKNRGLPVFAYTAKDYRETLGVNTKEELLELEKLLKKEL